MADLFTSLVSISPLVSQAKGKGESRIPGLSPTVKSGISSNRASAAAGKSPAMGHEYDVNTFALWRFDETSGLIAADVGGLYPLTATAGFTIAAGKFGNARNILAGDADKLSRPGSLPWQTLLQLGSYTIEMWIYRQNGFNTLFRYMSAGDWPLNIFVDTGGLSAPNQIIISSAAGTVFGPVLPDNAWSHMAFRNTRVGVNNSTWTLFLNSVVVHNSTGRTDTVAGASQELRIGENFGGKIEDTRVSNVARSNAEILASYTRGLGQP